MPPESLQSVTPIVLNKTDERLVQKAIKTCKSRPIVEALEALRDGRSVVPTVFPDIIGFLEQPSSLHLSPYKAVVILCRTLPPGSAEADRVCAILTDQYHTLNTNDALMGCLGPLLGLVAALFLNSTSPGVISQNLSPTYRVYLETLSILKSAQGAYLVADLARTERHVRPTDLGAEALTALPPLLERAATCKPGDLPATHAVAFAKLVAFKPVPESTKLLALNAVEAIGTSATAASLQGLDRKEISPTLTSELDRVIGVLMARSQLEQTAV